MIELFIALFGGLYYLIRYVIDKSKGREFDREVEKREMIRKKSNQNTLRITIL